MEGIFTFESLQEMDHHVRSRPEGQGENLSWRLDGGPTKWLYLREYRPVTSKEKVTPSKDKRKNRPELVSIGYKEKHVNLVRSVCMEGWRVG